MKHGLSRNIRHKVVPSFALAALGTTLLGSAASASCGTGTQGQNQQSQNQIQNQSRQDPNQHTFTLTSYDRGSGHGSGHERYSDYSNDDDASGGYGSNDSYSQADIMLRSALQEHVAITVPALKAELLDEPDRDALMDAVNNNSAMIADAVESRYSGSRDEFLTLWQTHIYYYLDYLHATESQDTTDQVAAKQNLTKFADQLSTWLSDHDNNYDKDLLNQMIAMHGNQVVQIIDSFANENYTQAYTVAHQAYVHMGDFADYLTRQDSNSDDQTSDQSGSNSSDSDSDYSSNGQLYLR